ARAPGLPARPPRGGHPAGQRPVRRRRRTGGAAAPARRLRAGRAGPAARGPVPAAGSGRAGHREGVGPGLRALGRHAVTAVDPATAARWRLRHLLLTGSTEPDPVAVLRRLAVVQGQDWLPAQWSLAQRSARPVTEPELLAAFDRGEILRTHVLRPTWHLLTPESIRVALTATADRVHRLNGHQYRLTGIDDEVARRARRVLEEVLPGRSLTRAELAEELARAGIEAAGVRLAHIIMWAELDQVVCSGPVRGRQH